MGTTRGGVPLQLAAMLASQLDIHDAIESGTYHGNSAVELRGEFDRVWSIELSLELHRSAAAHHSMEGLHFVHGSSPEVLPELLEGRTAPALFWLDGHWSAGNTAGADLECPVLAEIAAIDAWGPADRSCILVDDARLFLGPPPPPHRRDAWPTFVEVFDALRRRFPDRFVTVLEDVIIAVPADAGRIVGDYWLAVQKAQPARRPSVSERTGKVVRRLSAALRHKLRGT